MDPNDSNQLLRAVLVAVDAGEESRRTIPLAKTVSRISRAPLHLIHSGDEGLSPGELARHLALGPEEIEGAVLETLAGPPEQSLLTRLGQPGNHLAIFAVSDEPGPVIRAVVEKARCPIVLVPPGSKWDSWRPRRVLLPQDSCAETAAAISPALRIVGANQGRLIVLHVPFYTRSFSDTDGALPLPRYMDQPQHELPAWEQEFLDRLRLLGHVPEQMDMNLVLGVGRPPHEEILGWSNRLGTDLIIMPWHPRFARSLEVLKKVLHGVPCPVLLLPMDTGAEIPLRRAG